MQQPAAPTAAAAADDDNTKINPPGMLNIGIISEMSTSLRGKSRETDEITDDSSYYGTY